MSEPTLPAKIVTASLKAGAHNDCLVAGLAGACADCVEIIMRTMHAEYGHLATSAKVIEKILEDLDSDKYRLLGDA